MNKSELKSALKGRTSEQKKVIKYFYGEGGCLSYISPGLKDADYDAMLTEKIKSMDFKRKALNKIGLDESEVTEIEPVHFEQFAYESPNILAKLGKDGKWRSTCYQLSWIYFSSTQIYVYQYTLNMNDDSKKESTEEYFYKDITNFSTVSDTVEKSVAVKVSCKGEVTYGRKNIDTDRFAVVVPGDKFLCAMTANEKSESSIQGMKAMLREKKNA